MMFYAVSPHLASRASVQHSIFTSLPRPNYLKTTNPAFMFVPNSLLSYQLLYGFNAPSCPLATLVM